MELLLSFSLAIAISLLVIPLMVRLAPAFGMLDRPEARKVHEQPVPRVGGWGIVLATLVCVAVWSPLEPLLQSYVFGSVALLAFGAWDDSCELSPGWKFLGQFIAVIPVVWYGGLYVEYFPFGIGRIPDLAAQGFTLFALLGMINAINHSDGLDGLAGGESLLSLAAIAALILLAGDETGLLIAIACMGGILGFLRYNTHPASLFMGDGGSQFLGFTLGFLAVLLTQRIDPTLSPAVVLLLLGLPVADILVVFYKRARGGMNWFRATRNHVHHRLLALGFVHAESVVLIYSVQSFLVLSGLALAHANDWLILAVYLGVCAAVFGGLNWAERRGWQPRARTRARREIRYRELLVVAPRRILGVGVPAIFVVGAVTAPSVSPDLALLSLGAAGLLLFERLLLVPRWGLLRRAAYYLLATILVYLHAGEPALGEGYQVLKTAVFAGLVGSVILAVRFSPRRRRHEFRATALDYLMILLALAVAILAELLGAERFSSAFVLQLTVLFYGMELLMVERRGPWTVLSAATVLAAAVLGIRVLG